MAGVTIPQILSGIETQLKMIPGLRTAAYVADQVNPPQAVVDFPNPFPYHGSFAHGTFQFEPTVILLVSKTVDRVGTAALATYASIDGTNSIHAAIEADRTLGGLPGMDCIVVDFRRLNQQEIDALLFFGGVFTLKVTAKGA